MNNKNSILDNILFALLVIFPLVFIAPVVNGDSFFIFNSGRYLINNGFTNTEPFTIHEGLKFSFEKWLSHIIFWELENNFGKYGLYAFLLIISSIMFYFCYKICKIYSKNKYVCAFSSSIICILINFTFQALRPQAISNLLLTIELYILEKYKETKNKKYLIFLPLLSILYVNIHSTMLVIFLIMALPYIFDNLFAKIFRMKFLKKTEYSHKTLIIYYFFSILAALINPAGYKSFIYIFKMYLSKSANASFIGELQPPNLNNSPDFFIMILFVFIILCYSLYNRKEINIYKILLIFGFMFMGLKIFRTICFFYISLAVIIPGFINNILNDFNISLYKNKIKSLKIFYILIIILAILIIGEDKYYDFENFYDTKYSDLECLDYLNKIVGDNKENIKLYTDYDNGAFFEYNGYKCYLDARSDVLCKESNGKKDYILEYSKFISGLIDFEKFQKEYNFDYWILNKNVLIYRIMAKSDKFIKVYETDRSYILKYKE